MVPMWLAAQATPTDMSVYVHLASFGMYDQERGVYTNSHPSLATICERTGFSRSTVQAAIRRMIDVGIVARRRRAGRDGRQTSNVYELAFAAPIRGAAAVAVLSGVDGTPLVEQPTPTDPLEEQGPDQTGPTETGTEPTDAGIQGPGQSGGEGPASRAQRRTLLKKTDQNIGEAAATPAAEITSAQQMLGSWIDVLEARGIRLTGQAKARYGREFKALFADGFDVAMIKEALTYMLNQQLVSRPALLQTIVVQIQTGAPKRAPVDDAPPLPGRYAHPCEQHPTFPAESCPSCTADRLAGGVHVGARG